MKVKFIIKQNDPLLPWETDLLDVPFKKGDTLNITAFKYFKANSNLEREYLPSFNGTFEIIDIVHRLTFDLVLSQNTTYEKCIVYLKRQ